MKELAAGVLIFVGIVISVQTIKAASGPPIPGAVSYEYLAPLGATRVRDVLFIVTHDTWGFNARGAMQRYMSGYTGRPDCPQCGTEWWIMADGVIYHAKAEGKTNHCRGVEGKRGAPVSISGTAEACNKSSVGIEFEGFIDKTAEQVKSGLALIRFLQDRYCIPSHFIFAHANGSGQSKQDGKTYKEGEKVRSAAREMGHRPGCNGMTPFLGVISPDLVDKTSQKYQPSIADLYYRSGPGTHVPTYRPLSSPLDGLQGLFNAFGGGSLQGTPAPIAPQPIAPVPPAAPGIPVSPSPLEGVDDAVWKAFEEAERKNPGSVVSIVIPSDNSSTASIVVEDDTGKKTVDVVSVTTEYVAPSTFMPPSPVESIPGSVQDTAPGTYSQLVQVWTRVRDILTTLVGYLTGNR